MIAIIGGSFGVALSLISIINKWVVLRAVMSSSRTINRTSNMSVTLTEMFIFAFGVTLIVWGVQ